MLTRNDRTVEDCLDLLDDDPAARPAAYRLQGCRRPARDARASSPPRSATPARRPTWRWCARRPRPASPRRASRATSASTGCSAARRSTRSWRCSRAATTEYYPFPGKPVGHPTKLGGTPEEVEAALPDFAARGCAGCDILAYRATEADPLELVRAARRGLGAGKRLIVAGAVTTAEQIRAIKHAGADAFTIGTAVFDGSYSPAKGSILSQLARRPCRLRSGLSAVVAVVGIDIGTQSLKAVVVDERPARARRGGVALPAELPAAGLGRAGSGAVARGARARRSRARSTAAGACAGRRHARSASPASSTAACRSTPAGGALAPCLDLDGPPRRARSSTRIAPRVCAAVTGLVLDATHMAAKIALARAHTARRRAVARLHQPVSLRRRGA